MSIRQELQNLQLKIHDLESEIQKIENRYKVKMFECNSGFIQMFHNTGDCTDPITLCLGVPGYKKKQSSISLESAKEMYNWLYEVICKEST